MRNVASGRLCVCAHCFHAVFCGRVYFRVSEVHCWLSAGWSKECLELDLLDLHERPLRYAVIQGWRGIRECRLGVPELVESPGCEGFGSRIFGADAAWRSLLNSTEQVPVQEISNWVIKAALSFHTQARHVASSAHSFGMPR